MRTRKQSCLAVALIALVRFTSACGDPSAPRNTLGPESLTVTLRTVPETITVSSEFSLAGAARNDASRDVFVRYSPGQCGVVLQIINPGMTISAPNPPCRGQGTVTIPSGDSLLNAVGSIAPPRVPGAYRVSGQFIADNGRSLFVERTIVVR